MSTRSPTSSGKPASSTIMAPRLESPLPEAESLSWFCPTLPPITVARTTNRIQPRMAVFRCVALQRPARAARFLGCKLLSPVVGVEHCGESSQPRGTGVGRASGVLSGEIPWGPARAGPRPPGAARTVGPWGAYALQVRQNGQHAPVPRRARRQLELGEDARDVALHHALADAEARRRSPGWTGPRPCARAPRARAARACRAGPRGARRSSIRATTSGSSAEPPCPTWRTALAKRVAVGHAVLEQVADALGALPQQLHRVGHLDVLREHEHAGAGQLLADRRAPPAGPRRCAWAASGCRRPRRRAGARAPRAGARRRRRPARRRRSPAPRSTPHDPRAQQHRVVGHDDAQRRAGRALARRRRRRARARRPPRARTRRPSAGARSRSLASARPAPRRARPAARAATSSSHGGGSWTCAHIFSTSLSRSNTTCRSARGTARSPARRRPPARRPRRRAPARATCSRPCPSRSRCA